MWEYKYSDELYHWKYSKKEKVNGKWRYYYDTDAVKSDIFGKANDVSDSLGTISPEASRKFDKMTYEVTKEAIDVSKDVKLAKIEKEHPDDSIMKAVKVSTLEVSSAVKTFATDVLQSLNDIGDGTIDNRIRKIAKEGMDFFRSLFGG